MSKKFLLLTLFFILAINITAVAVEEPQYGGTLYLENIEDWDTIDPAYCSGFDAGEMAVKIFDGLVRFDYYSNNLVPNLAESWEVKNDNKTFIFKIRKGVKFHNGRDLTAKDVKYTFDRLYDPETASPGTWVYDMIVGTDAALNRKTDGLKGVTVVDEYTVRFDLQYPFGLFLTHLTLPYGLIVPEEEVAKWGDQFSQHPVGTGPWKFVEWKHDEKLVLGANEDYWQGRPYLDRVEYRVIPQALTRVAEFEAGTLDYITIPPQEIKRWTGDPEWQPYLHKMAELSSYYLALNDAFEPLDNPLVKKAIALAVDSKQITEAIFPEYVPANDPIPEEMPGGIDKAGLGYDPEKAKELLAEAGYPDGFDLEIWVSSEEKSVRIGGVLQALLKRVGINVTLIKNDWSVFFSTVKNGNAPAYYLSWWADYADPYNFLDALYASEGSRINYKNEKVDKILAEMTRTTSAAERVDISKELIKKVRKGGDPYVWLYHTSSTTVKQPWVKGELHHQMYDADKLVTWWIDQDLK